MNNIQTKCRDLESPEWENTKFINDNGKPTSITTKYLKPTRHIEWLPKLHIDDYNEPEWRYIPFGNNHVPWLTFRRGVFGNNWNGWEPVSATEENAVILQSTFEPVAIQVDGVWLITFKK